MAISQNFGKMDAGKIRAQLIEAGYIPVNDMQIVDENGYCGAVVPRTGRECPEGCTYAQRQDGIAVMINDEPTNRPLVFIKGNMASPDLTTVGHLKQMGFRNGGNETFESGRFAGLDDDGKRLTGTKAGFDPAEAQKIAESLDRDADAYVSIVGDALATSNKAEDPEVKSAAPPAIKP